VPEPVETRSDLQADSQRYDYVEQRANHRLEETVQPEAAAPAFDPYVVLGVPRDAGQDAIGTAYDLARKRYDPEQVSFLGYEAQEHFRVKAESIERAYRMLLPA
jgi:preprotein translocase subunit Sec63